MRGRRLVLVASVWVLATPTTAVAVPGVLDSTFGSDGKALTSFAGVDSIASGVVVDSGGRVVAAGYVSTDGGDDFALVRYAPDGSLDPTFGGDGRVRTAWGDRAFGFAVAMQPDGKIVVAGQVDVENEDSHFALARYLPDGTLDPTFGGDGKVTTSYRDQATALGVAVQPDGTIVGAGWVWSLERGFRIALARYLPDGTLDPTFGNGGRVVSRFDGSSEAHAVTVQSDGKIVVFGAPAVVRYQPDGTLDPTFGQGGMASTDLTGCGSGGSVNDGLVQPDGKILAAGVGLTNRCKSAFVLVRFQTDGRLDTTFSDNGKVRIGFPGDAYGTSVALQSDGKIVMAGFDLVGGDVVYQFALARFTENGLPDASFGKNGKVETAVGGWSQAMDVTLGADGKIVAAGIGGGGRFAVARYLAA